MRLGYSIGTIGTGMSPEDHADLVQTAERSGYDSAWSSETPGTDPVALLAWLAARTSRIALGSAVLQITARTAVTTANTAVTLQRLSGGRLRLGIGTSGPQVTEGWHGVPFDRPLTRLREYTQVLRLALSGKPVAYTGQSIALPVPGKQAVALPLIGTANLAPVPIYLAGIGDRAIRLAAEAGDGWLAIHCPPSYVCSARELLAAGAAESDRDLAAIDVAVMVQALIDDDIELARDLMRPSLALYLGGMGSAKTNYYNRLARQLGYGAAAQAVRDAYALGDIDAAMDSLPDDLIDEMTICGPPEYVRQRLAEYRDAGTTTLIVRMAAPAKNAQHEQIAQLAELNKS